MKITLPPLTQLQLNSSVPIIALNTQQVRQPIIPARRHVFTTQNQTYETQLAPLKPVPVMRTIVPAVPVQQSAYPFIVEDPSFIQLTTTKHISETRY